MIAHVKLRKYSAFFLTVAALTVSTLVIFSTTIGQDRVGALTVTGMVRVNGSPAATGDIVVSGSGVQTAAHSSAVVSIGKLGRVELLPDSKMELRYDLDANTIGVRIDKGSVRLSTGPGVSATVVRSDQ
jgi:hypothetical protein